ncbi:MAG: DNA protein [Thermotogaceae bacterium]|nr:DNA protein [Thermotogaceae bacterium]
MDDMKKYSESIFEAIKMTNEYGQEFWSARDLQDVLGYTEWRKFSNVINKAKEACENSINDISVHFVDVDKKAEIGLNKIRIIKDILLSRYACYLIVQNADPRKKIIALGQTYFAVKTRQQELIEDYDQMTEEGKRLAIRNEMKKHNKSLAEAANQAGVVDNRDFAVFQNHGYRGLYGGLTAGDIKKSKKLKKNEQILDHMGSTELAANLFRATQTDEKLRRDKIHGKDNANRTHFQVGKKVRETIEELGGTMPEDLPTPEKGIKEIEKERKKRDKELDD